MFVRIISIYSFNNIHNSILSYMRSACRSCLFFNYRNICNMFMGNGCRSRKLYDAMEGNFSRNMEYDYGNNHDFKESYRFDCLYFIPVPCTYGMQFRIECIQHHCIIYYYRLFSYILYICRNKYFL